MHCCYRHSQNQKKPPICKILRIGKSKQNTALTYYRYLLLNPNCAMQEDKFNNGSDSSLIGRIVENLTGYVDTKINLFKLDIQLKMRDAMVNAMHFGVLAITGLLTLLFLSITLGLALNDLLDSSWLG
ncbi:MAG: phage holin family protein, partial [Chitinophagaceae bacterium]